jgi:serine/threonine-protein kinase
MNRVLNGEIPSPREKKPEVPEELERICMKALASDRNNRYPTAADLEQDLENFLGSLGAEGRVTGRQIGKLVDKLFEDVRVRTKALVEAQLSKVASLSWAEYQASQQLVQAPTMTFSNSTAGSTISDSVDQMKRMRRRSAYLPWVGGAAAALLFLFLWRTFAKEPPPAPVAVAPPPAPTETQPSEQRGSNKVQIRVSASPSDAKLYFDNDQLPSNPYAGPMTADGNQHTVRAEANGYTSSSTAFVLDRDADIVLALERSKGQPSGPVGPSKPTRGGSPHSGPAPASPPAPPPASPPPAPAAAKPDCTPPYYVDQRGIKRYKPECM